MKRQHVAVVALVAMFALAGCADATVTTTVDSDGEVEQIQMEAEVDQYAYGVMLEEANAEGSETVSGVIAAEFDDEMGDGITDVEHEDRRDGETYVLDITANQVDVERLGGMETEETDEDTILYTAEDLQSATVDEVDDMTYRVEMPSEITETNADDVDEDNNVAMWNVDDTDVETASVESEQDSFSLWTLAALTGVGALVLIGGFVVYRRIGEGYVETNDTP